MIRAARQGRRFLLFRMQENGVSVRITGESAFEKTAGGESMTKKQYGDEAERLAPSSAANRLFYRPQRARCAGCGAAGAAFRLGTDGRTLNLARLKPYLARAVINACRDIQRARQKAIPVETVPESGYEPPDSALYDAVERLPEELRLPLLLHYMEGYKLAEIAGALGQSLPQLTSRLFRARKLLRRMLEEVEA